MKQQKKFNILFLPWHRAECESWWFAHGCPLGGSHRTLSKEKETVNKIWNGQDKKLKPVHFNPSIHAIFRSIFLAFRLYLLTFDFVCCSSADLSFTILQKVLEGRHQIVLGDLWSHCFLELHLERINTSQYLNKHEVNISIQKVRKKTDCILSLQPLKAHKQ